MWAIRTLYAENLLRSILRHDIGIKSIWGVSALGVKMNGVVIFLFKKYSFDDNIMFNIIWDINSDLIYDRFEEVVGSERTQDLLQETVWKVIVLNWIDFIQTDNE